MVLSKVLDEPSNIIVILKKKAGPAELDLKLVSVLPQTGTCTLNNNVAHLK